MGTIASYEEKQTLQDNDYLLIQDSKYKKVKMKKVKEYVENNSSIINGLANKIIYEDVTATIPAGADYFHVPNKTGHVLVNMYINNWQSANGYMVRSISIDAGQPVGLLNKAASSNTNVPVRCIWIKD